MSMEVIINGFRWDDWGRKLVAEIGVAIEETVRFIPLDQTRRIAARSTPEGGSQQANKPGTAARKLKTLGHDIPLRGQDRILCDPARYPIARIDGGWAASLPVMRAEVVERLRIRGYRYWGMSAEILAHLRRQLSLALDRAEAAIPSYRGGVT